jgi:flagellar biosynthesis/type III secretory pathway M-ring protein FliF/YscJ
MDLFKSQLDRVRQQLAGLTPSQKMLSAALVAIMVMTLVWFGKYAGSPEMVPLLTQALSPDELGRIEQQLRLANISYKSSADGKLLVSSDSQMSALATLNMSNSLPKNISSGFDDMIKQLTAWDGQDRQNAVFNHGKELSLERVVAAYPGVRSATVIIDPHSKRLIGRENIEPVGSVSVQMKDDSDGSKQLANACANLVSGAQAGLSPAKITVIIGKKLWPITRPGDPADGGMEPGTLLETQVATERLYTDKIEKQLGDIQGVRVAVTVKVNNASEASESIRYDRDGSLIEDQDTTSQTTEQTSAAPAAAESGVLANVQPMTVAGGGAVGGQSSSESKDTVKKFIAPGMKKTVQKRAAGEPIPVGASVRVPRSYFSLVAKGMDPAAKDPDKATVDRLIADEIAKIRKDVIACTGIASAERITVDAYADLVQASRTPEVATASAMTLAVGGHVKEIALGGLALASLFMMSMIVRKGAPAVAVATAASSSAAAALAAAAAASRLEGGEPLAGEVSGGAMSLDGVELDDDSIKSQQMLGQVTAMVGDNPEAAATLIKRWMNQR